MNLFDTLLINPIVNLLIVFYTVLDAVKIPGALGFSIILLTVLIRLALWPLTGAQLKSSKKMAELKPHLEKIKGEHGHDKIRHQAEVSKLYKEHGVNPLSGCLPLLLQIPVFIALYQVLLKFVSLNSTELLSNINDRIYIPALKLESIPNASFFGLNLSVKPNEWSTVGIFILAIPVLTGVLQFVQSKMLVAEDKKTAPVVKKIQSKNKKEQKESLEDSMGQMQSQMSLIMPAMIAFFAYGFPIGLSLYWNTFTVIGIVQQYKIMGAGSLNKYLPEKWRK